MPSTVPWEPRLWGQVQSHLQQVRNDPSTLLDRDLLGMFDPQHTGMHPPLPLGLSHVYTDSKLLEVIAESDRETFLNLLSDVIPTLQQDPMPVINLIALLVLPERYDFKRLLAIQPPINFLDGLAYPMPSVNLATLSLLKKATDRTSDIEIVAGTAGVVYELINLWLRTPDTAVATQSHNLIVRFLLGDRFVDNGLMWRRIFRDKDTYLLIFTICSTSTVGQEGQLSLREKTISQARLLDILLEIDANSVRTSQIPEVEQRFGVVNGGLLQFAAIHMVDYQNDVMMHVNLMEFYTNYLKKRHTFALPFLQSNGLHARSMAFYLEPEKQDSIDVSLLYGASAKYIAAYCSGYPQDLMSSPTAERILSRVEHVLALTSSNQWAQGNAPNHDLYVLASLPRVMLIPSTTPTRASSPLFLIPVNPANPDALASLAHILQSCSRNTYDERAAARALYFFEMERFPDFWEQIVTAADTVALTESALMAISVIRAVVEAKWFPLHMEPSASTNYALPLEDELADMCHVEALPRSGYDAIMTQPALGIVIPYLLRPAKNGSLVGGGRGDVKSAGYKIAVAKYEVLELLHHQLEDGNWSSSREKQEVLAAMARRLVQGPLGGMAPVGGRVETMEL